MEETKTNQEKSVAKEQNAMAQKPYNLEPNIEAALAYLPFVGFFTSLAIFFVEKNDRFVRFHALQGLLLGGGHLFVCMALAVTIIFSFLITLVNLIAFAAWCYMMWDAYNKREYELPIIGKIARDQLK